MMLDGWELNAELKKPYEQKLEEWRNKVEYDEDLMEKAKKVKALYEKK